MSVPIQAYKSAANDQTKQAHAKPTHASRLLSTSLMVFPIVRLGAEHSIFRKRQSCILSTRDLPTDNRQPDPLQTYHSRAIRPKRRGDTPSLFDQPYLFIGLMAGMAGTPVIIEQKCTVIGWIHAVTSAVIVVTTGCRRVGKTTHHRG